MKWLSLTRGHPNRRVHIATLPDAYLQRRKQL